MTTSISDLRRTARAPGNRSLGIAAVSLATLIWGFVPLILRSTDMPSMSFAMYRLWTGVAIYAVWFGVTRRRPSWATIRACALGGVFFAADISLTFAAFKLTTVANATIIGALSPVIIALAAARMFGERIDRRDLMLVGASFAGVVVVGIGSAGAPSWSPLGDALALLSTVSWAAYWLFSKRARNSATAVEYMASVMLVAAVVVTIVTIPSGLVGGFSLAPPSGMDLVWVGVVAIFPGTLGHLLVAWSHRQGEAWLLSLITQMVPVIATIAAWLVLGETLTTLALAGGAAVMIATAIIVVRASRKASPDPADEHHLTTEDVETATERAG